VDHDVLVVAFQNRTLQARILQSKSDNKLYLGKLHLSYLYGSTTDDLSAYLPYTECTIKCQDLS